MRTHLQHHCIDTLRLDDGCPAVNPRFCDELESCLELEMTIRPKSTPLEHDMFVGWRVAFTYATISTAHGHGIVDLAERFAVASLWHQTVCTYFQDNTPKSNAIYIIWMKEILMLNKGGRLYWYPTIASNSNTQTRRYSRVKRIEIRLRAGFLPSGFKTRPSISNPYQAFTKRCGPVFMYRLKAKKILEVTREKPTNILTPK